MVHPYGHGTWSGSGWVMGKTKQGYNSHGRGEHTRVRVPTSRGGQPPVRQGSSLGSKQVCEQEPKQKAHERGRQGLAEETGVADIPGREQIPKKKQSICISHV